MVRPQEQAKVRNFVRSFNVQDLYCSNSFYSVPEFLPSNDSRLWKKAVKSILQNTKIGRNSKPNSQDFPFSPNRLQKYCFLSICPLQEKISEDDTLENGTSPSNKYTKYPPPPSFHNGFRRGGCLKENVRTFEGKENT